MTNPPPFSNVELQFRSVEDFALYWRQYADVGTAIWLWHETLGDRDEIVEIVGICDYCQTNSKFTVRTNPQKEGRFKFRVSWSELTCQNCKIDSRDRSILTHISNTAQKDDKIYHVGYYSNLSNKLSQQRPNFVRSQYKAGITSGVIDENGIRYEDLTKLSFSDNIVNHIVCSEILEHIPDYKISLKEMYRILTKDGQAILTFPWLGGEYYEHLIRAEMLADGSIKHYLPPEYHGDPASSEGILSFRAFGWKILEELLDVGFRDAYAQYKLGPLHGHMTLIHPIIVAIK